MKSLTFDYISDLQDELMASSFASLEQFMSYKFGDSWEKDSWCLEIFQALEKTMEYSDSIEEI